MNTTPRAGYVSWLAFDPIDHNIVYATYSTFSGIHVWRSVDGGATWAGIDGADAGALPDVPVHSIVVDPQNRSRLFIGTDVGVFVTTDGGQTWAVESGMPNVVTEALALNTGSTVTQIFAFTYGRGAWRTSLGTNDCRYSLSPTSVNIKPEGGAGSVPVTAPSGGCPWSASVNSSGEGWIKIANSGPGSGSGTISFTVEPNGGGLARTGTIAIAGRSFTISQAGKPDTQRPEVKITGPTNERRLTTELSTITLNGTASDDTGIAQVNWATDRGSISINPLPASGQANGTTAWTTPAITLQPGVNVITITARDTAGNTGSAELTVIFNPAATLITIAGAGTKGEGHPAYYAGLSVPKGMTLDATGNLYFCSGDSVLKIDARTSIISTLAGAGSLAELGDGGPATQARLNYPRDVALDSAGNLFIADLVNNRVRKVDAATGIITTVAGNGRNGGPFVEGEDALTTATGSLNAVAIGPDNNLYVTTNSQIRKINLVTGKITTFVQNGIPIGNGGAVINQNYYPLSLAFDAAGNLLFTDAIRFNTSYIPKVWRVAAQTGSIAWLAGDRLTGPLGDGGPAVLARLEAALDAAVDAAGNIYIADGTRVRKLTPIPAASAASNKLTR